MAGGTRCARPSAGTRRSLSRWSRTRACRRSGPIRSTGPSTRTTQCAPPAARRRPPPHAAPRRASPLPPSPPPHAGRLLWTRLPHDQRYTSAVGVTAPQTTPRLWLRLRLSISTHPAGRPPRRRSSRGGRRPRSSASRRSPSRQACLSNVPKSSRKISTHLSTTATATCSREGT